MSANLVGAFIIDYFVIVRLCIPESIPTSSSSRIDLEANDCLAAIVNNVPSELYRFFISHPTLHTLFLNDIGLDHSVLHLKFHLCTSGFVVCCSKVYSPSLSLLSYRLTQLVALLNVLYRESWLS